jgi:hypothetical protein
MELANASPTLTLGRLVSELMQVAFCYVLDILNASIQKVEVSAVPQVYLSAPDRDLSRIRLWPRLPSTDAFQTL